MTDTPTPTAAKILADHIFDALEANDRIACMGDKDDVGRIAGHTGRREEITIDGQFDLVDVAERLILLGYKLSETSTSTARSSPVSEDAKAMALRVGKVLLDATTSAKSAETMRLIADVTQALTP